MITVRKHELESIAVIIKPCALLPSKIMNAAIENLHATVVNKCFWILCILLVSSNPVMAFNSSYFKKTGDALGSTVNVHV